MKKEEFVIIVRGGAYVAPYVSQVVLSEEDEDWLDWKEEEGDDAEAFDCWCNFELNEMVNEFEDNGATAIVLSLNEYQNLPKL
jgi:hypothetical protein